MLVSLSAWKADVLYILKSFQALVYYTLLKLQFNVVFQLRGQVHKEICSGALIKKMIGMPWERITE